MLLGYLKHYNSLSSLYGDLNIFVLLTILWASKIWQQQLTLVNQSLGLDTRRKLEYKAWKN